ncbi:MAG: hypothetical protein OIN90_08095, partial [Candidatus Methanoperedens sp.]|nr:hypothetical protein [Candidatus Methanoperedens sp.]
PSIPTPQLHIRSVTRQGVGFSSEVAASLSSCWICTSWRLRTLLGAPVRSVVSSSFFECLRKAYILYTRTH